MRPGSILHTLILVVFILSILGIDTVEQNIVDAQTNYVDVVDDTAMDEEILDLDAATSTTNDQDEKLSNDDNTDNTTEVTQTAQSIPNEDSDPIQTSETVPVQSGPLIDLFGPTLLSLERTGEGTAKMVEHHTSDALRNKNVIGVYFSADWCGPCRKFTPDLVKFYEKMNKRRGKKDEFQIVWVSRCRDVQSYGQYFTHMPWIALPPQEALGARGEQLSKHFGVKGIPTLVLLDDFGGVITKDGRNMIPKDKAGIGFPWRNPLSQIYVTLVPRSLRFMVKRELGTWKDKTLGRIKNILRFPGSSSSRKKNVATKV